MSKSAIVPKQPFDELDSQAKEASTAAWKQEVNQRLAAHRNRRGGPQDAPRAEVAETPRTASGRAAEAAARVAARYAKAPSYSQLLAGEARAVVRAAGAAAEAARHAQAAAEAVLAGLESAPIASGLWEPAPAASVLPPVAQPAANAAPARWQDEPPAAPPAPAAAALNPWAGAQPRWEEALPVTAPAPAPGRDVWSEMRVHPSPQPGTDQGVGPAYEENFSPDGQDGDLFPYDPVGSATVEPVQHLPANLIEFPRELTAPRKARPRLAEGPFYDASHENDQLSIFEVDPELLAPPIAMHSGEAVAPPEWASIELDHPTEPAHAEPEYAAHAYADTAHLESQYAYASEVREAAYQALPVEVPAPVAAAEAPVFAEPVLSGRVPTADSARTAVAASPVAAKPVAAELLVARLSDRLLATVVDCALVTLACVAAAVVVIASTAHPPTGRIALIAAGCGLLIFGLLYQFLFLSYAEEGTPGMRYARIALCTFRDDNPTREQMRMRIPAMILAALPAGLGLLWAIFDRDHLGWHDRLTKTYQRKY